MTKNFLPSLFVLKTDTILFYATLPYPNNLDARWLKRANILTSSNGGLSILTNPTYSAPEYAFSRFLLNKNLNPIVNPVIYVQGMENVSLEDGCVGVLFAKYYSALLIVKDGELCLEELCNDGFFIGPNSHLSDYGNALRRNLTLNRKEVMDDKDIIYTITDVFHLISEEYPIAVKTLNVIDADIMDYVFRGLPELYGKNKGDLLPIQLNVLTRDLNYISIDTTEELKEFLERVNVNPNDKDIGSSYKANIGVINMDAFPCTVPSYTKIREGVLKKRLEVTEFKIAKKAKKEKEVKTLPKPTGKKRGRPAKKGGMKMQLIIFDNTTNVAVIDIPCKSNEEWSALLEKYAELLQKRPTISIQGREAKWAASSEEQFREWMLLINQTLENKMQVGLS